MCGITGSVGTSPGRVHAGAQALAASMQALAHRGPDHAGMWSDDHCALGFRRLSIIDLSAAGNQPMAFAGGELHIVFNGEIYNFLELRKELEQCGHTFESQSDTEVLLAAYRQWDTACVEHLRGMFAIALWDSPRRRIFLARDRAGKKPLFYAQREGILHFASELQGLMCYPEIERTPSYSAIEHYLARGYVPAPMTAFADVHKLPPAHWMTVEVKDGRLKQQVKKYWTLSFMPKRALTMEEAEEALRQKLTDAVRLRLISDVPLGAFLSGGIDSSIVVGLMAQLSNRPVKTFSIGFEQKSFDELSYARLIAEKWKTDHTEFVVTPAAADVLPMLVRHFGEPFADSSAVPTYYVAKLTRQHVTVALTGDGGDESFAGYERYFALRGAEKLRVLPGAKHWLQWISNVLPDSNDMHNRMRRVKRFLGAVPLPTVERYDAWLGYFNTAEREPLINEGARDSMRKSGPGPDAWLGELFRWSHNLDLVESAMAVDIASYLPYDLLVKVDIATMASGLEARSPFLDHEFMELAASLPVHYKLRGMTSKFSLKRAFAGLLPDEIRYRPKRGFGVPLADWLRGPLNGILRDALAEKTVKERGILEPKEVARLLEEHSAGTMDHSAQLWCLLMLEMWFREMVEKKSA